LHAATAAQAPANLAFEEMDAPLIAAFLDDLELTAADGITTLEEVRTLLTMNVHAALGMEIYTGRLKL
jgi:hypothetical protein